MIYFYHIFLFFNLFIFGSLILFYFFIHCWLHFEYHLKEFGNLVDDLIFKWILGGGIYLFGKIIINKFLGSSLFVSTSLKFLSHKDAFWCLFIWLTPTCVFLSSKYFGTTCWIDKCVKFFEIQLYFCIRDRKIPNNLEKKISRAWRYKVM